MIGALIAAVVVAGIFVFSKNTLTQSKTGLSTSALEAELSRFQALLTTDLERAGNDSSGDGILRVYRVRTGTCTTDTFYYGLVQNPAANNCTTKIGDLGIVSYLGIDVDRNGSFFPEEGLKLSAPALRPPAPTAVTPAAPATLPVNFYNDYIVYSFDASTNSITRKNLGDPTTATGDTSEVVLKNAVSFAVTFDNGPLPDVTPTPAAGTYFNRVTITVVIAGAAPEQEYANPTLAANSPFYRHRTASRSFSFDVITSALSVN